MLCDRYAERSVAVQHGGADLEFCDLTIEVAYHEALPQQLNAMHLRLSAASAVISAPFSPDGATEVFRGAQGPVAGDRARGQRFPRLGVLAWRNDGMGASVGDGVVALARVVGAVRGDCAEVHINGELVKELGQHGRVADAAPGDLNGSDLQRLFVDTDVDLAPQTAFIATMLAGVPLAFTSALIPVLSISRFSGPCEPR